MNRVELVGRLTSAQEIKKAQSGTDLCDFTIAVERIRKVEGQPEADFISCRAFGSTAQFMFNYMKKGYLASVEGRIQTSTSGEGTNRKYYTTIICESVQNLTPRKQDGSVDEAKEKLEGLGITVEEETPLVSDGDLPF